MALPHSLQLFHRQMERKEKYRITWSTWEGAGPSEKEFKSTKSFLFQTVIIPIPFLKSYYFHPFISYYYYYLIFVSMPPEQKFIPGLTSQYGFEDENWVSAEKIIKEKLSKTWLKINFFDSNAFT